MADLTDRPTVLQEEIFNELFDTAEIANFTRNDQEVYENSLKYYRDWYAVSTSLKEEGRKEGRKEGREEGREEERSQNLARQRSLLVRLLPRTVGELSNNIKAQINQLSIEQLELLNELFWDFTTINDLIDWLNHIEPI